jgi:ABC-2 type transport system permease protein
VKAQLRSELLKQRSTSTNLSLLAAMLGLVLLAVVLHGIGIEAADLGRRNNQLMVFGRGEFLGALFAALLGAMSFTAEIRHGTIRPTFLVSPWRGRVVAAKVGASTLAGAVFGLAASALAVGVGTAVLRMRGINIQLDGGDYALLVAGGSAASAIWAAIGVGLGAVVRDQVPAHVVKFAPGTLGMAISGQEPDEMLAPGLSLLLLFVYAAVSVIAGTRATSRRDVA